MVSMAHDKGNVFAVHLGLADDKGNEQGNRSNIWWEKMFAVRQ
jgi:hypothetical protein